MLLSELDTVSDFVWYLTKKEALIASGKLGMATGEEGLLGWYLAKVNHADEHDFVIPMIEMHQTTPPDMRRLRVLTPSKAGDPYWVFLLVPFAHEISYRQYRDGRRAFLGACMQVAKLMNPDALDIVGFATESGRGSAGSEDALYYDARSWTEEDAREARRLQREFEILLRPTRFERTEPEYPPAPVAPPG